MCNIDVRRAPDRLVMKSAILRDISGKEYGTVLVSLKGRRPSTAFLLLRAPSESREVRPLLESSNSVIRWDYGFSTHYNLQVSRLGIGLAEEGLAEGVSRRCCQMLSDAVWARDLMPDGAVYFVIWRLEHVQICIWITSIVPWYLWPVYRRTKCRIRPPFFIHKAEVFQIC